MPAFRIPGAVAAALGLTALLAAQPAAAASPAPVLPTVKRTLTASVQPGTACAMAPAARLGRGSTTYKAPIDGYLNVALSGAGDWDLALRDAAGRRLDASQGLGGKELVQRWVKAGDTINAVACRRPGATGTAKLAFQLVDTEPTVQKGVTRLVEVAIADQAQVQRLEALGLDTTHDQTAHSAKVLLNGDADLATLTATGMRFTTVQADVFKADLKQLAADQQRSASLGAKLRAAGDTLPSGRTTYRTYEDYQADLKKLADANPGLVRLVSIGKSYQGRDITGVEIGTDVNGVDGRPTYFVMGVHHAREWPAGEAAMEYATMLTKGTGDARIKALLDRERTLVVPLVNPDGFVVSRTSFSPSDTIGCPVPSLPQVGNPTCDLGQTPEAVAPPGGFGAYRRKNCDAENMTPMQPCETAYGVDNNRNYGNLWGGSGGSPDLTSQAYHGRSPRSEPETQAVFNYVRTHHVTTLITLHTVAGLVLRPPGLKQLGLAPDEKRMKEIGDAMATAAGYTSQYSWQLYDTAGTTEDDTYAATGGYGYTYELGTEGGPFHGPYADSVIAEWTGNNTHAKNKGGVREALLLGGEAADSDADHAILQGSAPAGRVLHLTKSFDTTTSPYCTTGVDPVLNAGVEPVCATGVQAPTTIKDTLDSKTTVPASGKFAWHIGQSTRPFVNGGAVMEETTADPTPVATIKGTQGTPMSTHNDTFTLPQDKGSLTVTLAADVPTDDYDIRVLKDGAVLGTSAGSPPGDEVVTFSDAKAGQYTVEVTNYAAIAGAYTTTVTSSTVKRTVTSGTKEAYTLTCEDTAGKVYSSQPLVIDRGQVITADLPCVDGGAAPTLSTPGAGGTTPGSSTSKLAFKVFGGRLKASHKGGIGVRVRCPKDRTATCKGKVLLRSKLARTKKAKTVVVARGRFTAKPGKVAIVRMTLTRAAFRALKTRSRIPVTVTATGLAGKEKLSSVRKLTLRRP